MINTSAKTYANSLIQANNNYEKILNDLNIVKDVLSSELYDVLENPSVSIKIKYDIIDEVFKNHVDEKIINFLKILADKNRIREFSNIIRAYSDEVDEINDIKRAEVVSVIELSEEQKNKVIEKLQNRLHKKVIVNWTQDSSIIGGLVVKYDDDVIDCSLKNKLEKISKI